MVVEGCPQLGHSLYRGMIASLHKKQQNLKQMIKHQFLNDKTEQQHFFVFIDWNEDSSVKVNSLEMEEGN